MKLLAFFTAYLLVGSVYSAPTSNNEDTIVVNPNNEGTIVVNPNNENTIVVNPNNEDTKVVNPNNENTVVVNPNNEDTIVVNPYNENTIVVNPNNENTIVVNPNNEDTIVVNPNNEDTIVANPNNENTIVVNPNNENTIVVNPNNEDSIVVTPEFYPDELVIYTAEHDIVNILLPLNALNFAEDTEEINNEYIIKENNNEYESDSATILFFVLADTVDGKRVDQGLYVRKKGEVTKLLDNGRDAAAANDETKNAYFGASDGIYIYDAVNNKAVKYGTVNDSIISIAKYNGSDLIYILTEDYVLYKVTEEGTKKELVESVVNAQQIVLDYANNLFYYTPDKSVYVLGIDGVKKIEGLPEQASYLTILKPPFILENGVPLILDNKSYIAYANGTSEVAEFVFYERPTASAMEATLIQYYAYNKKIYEYNIVTLLFTEIMSGLKEFLNDKTSLISEIVPRSVSNQVA